MLKNLHCCYTVIGAIAATTLLHGLAFAQTTSVSAGDVAGSISSLPMASKPVSSTQCGSTTG